MFLIDKRGERPVCASCHKLGPYVKALRDVFVCGDCIRSIEEQIQAFAESVPELRDHRLKRWRFGCDCAGCRQRLDRAV
jgi:hypothetical protein